MKSIDPAEASDVALVELSRNGVNEAFAELWKRHSAAALAATRAFTGFEPEDVVQEAFLRVLQQIRAGQGPQTAFRAYLIMTARNVAHNMARSKSSSEITGVANEVFEEMPASTLGLETTVLRSAFTQQVFSSLPTRWQEVLWYREVEDLPVKDMCIFLGMTENATSVLLKRAREGFKQAWIGANLDPASGLSADCQWVVEKLPQLARGKAPAAMRKKLAKHFETCTRCAILSEQAEHVHTKLAMALLPGVLGVTGATGYLSWLQTGSAAPASAATFDVSAAMSATDVYAAPEVFSATTNSKMFTGTVTALSLGALVASIAFTSAGGLHQTQISADRPVRQASPNGTPTTADGGSTDESTNGKEVATSPNRGQHPEFLVSDPSPSADDMRNHGVVSETTRTDSDGPDLSTEFRYSPLRGESKYGVEEGVYPELVGTSAPNAVINFSLHNELGQKFTDTTVASVEGDWSYTPKGLMGSITISARQTFEDGKQETVDPIVQLGRFEVGRGLRIRVEATGADTTSIHIVGRPGESENHVVTLESSELGTLALQEPISKKGEYELIVPVSPSEIGDIHYWQGASAQGPQRIWVSER